MPYAAINDTERRIDLSLGIHTSRIDEWDQSMIDYHRSEPTPYIALDRLIEHYQPLENAFLVDYGSGLGRINLYLNHRLELPGLGIEVDPDRVQQAWENLMSYAQTKQLPADRIDISFLGTKAEDYLPPEKANTFYLFHPFSDWIFREVLDQIVRSIDQWDRTVDIILYYPSFGYFQSLQHCSLFEEWLFVDCPWNKDERDGFWVFRHRSGADKEGHQ